MRLGSLCTGYGGLDLAVETHHGAETVWMAETDPHASTLLATRWAGVPNLGDLTTVDWHQVEAVDILTAGFPCQPFSTAGQRKGNDDERAIFSYVADAISVLRPGRVVLENVPGILTLGGPSVIATLTGLGYDCRWGIVRASDTGAPHRRARWFCIAQPADTDSERHGERQNHRGMGHLDRNDAEQTRQRQRPRQIASNRSPTTAADANVSGLESVRPQRRLATTTHEPRATHRLGAYEPAAQRWEHILGRPAPQPTDQRGLRPEFVEWMMGLPEGWVCDLGLPRTAALKMLGNGVVPQQAALALELLT